MKLKGTSYRDSKLNEPEDNEGEKEETKGKHKGGERKQKEQQTQTFNIKAEHKNMKEGRRNGRASTWGEMEQGGLRNQFMLPVLCFAFLLAKSLLISFDGAGNPEAHILVSPQANSLNLQHVVHQNPGRIATSLRHKGQTIMRG